jgi:hypothetical protein
LDWSTVAKCGISASDLDEARLAIQERIDQIDAEVGDDDFTNGVLHANRWKQDSDNYPCDEDSGKITCTLPDENIQKLERSGVSTNSLTRHTWKIHGDFDVSMDWTWGATQADNIIYMRTRYGSSWIDVERYRIGTTHQFRLSSSSGVIATQATTAVSGTFRIARSGNNADVYANGSKLGTRNIGTDPIHLSLSFETLVSRSSGWGGDSATFDGFEISDGTVKWYRQDATDDTLDSISLPDVAAFGEVWPVSAVNAYRSALEAIIPYFFDGVETPTRYTKSTLLTAAISATDWTDSPLSALLVPAKRQHLNDLYEACRKAIYLPSDDDVDDNGFDEPSWDYPD